jgi:PDZ domain/Aspartyl protease
MALSWTKLLILASLAALAASPTGAQNRSEDQPPPPGALERELGLPPGEHVAAAPSSGRDLASAIEIPFILEGGHIIVEASIDANPPRPFMFDTGARNLISRDAAQPLNASVIRTARIGGVGTKISHSDIIKVGRIAIGAAVLEQQTVIVVDLPNIIVDRGSRPRLAGLIGSELLARYAVTIDFARRTLILNSPGFRPQLSTFALPLGFAIAPDGLSHPSITAELDGVAGDFIIDTGANSQVFVSDGFQRAHRPFAKSGRTLQFLSAGGIGGRTNIQMGFGRRLRIGPLTLSPPVVAGSTDSGGARLGASAGLIGTAILSQFVVTIDYQSARAYFAPVAGRTLPTVLHGTGMILDKPDHEAFEVLDVLAGSAADRAGLRRGDRIVEIDGHLARDLGNVDVQALSSVPAYASVTIRTSDQRRLDLAIGRLLP